MLRQRIYTAVLAVAMIAALSACGVKSSPKHPEGSSYPRVYPAAESLTIKPAASSSKAAPYAGGYVRNNRVDSSGYYTPPPPATETLVK